MVDEEEVVAFLVENVELLRIEKALRSADYTLGRLGSDVPPSVKQDVEGAVRLLNTIRGR